MNPARDTSKTRQRLLEAGRELFHRRGFAAVGINEICRAASAAKGSFYHFFPSKDALLEAVIDEHAANLLASLAAANQSAASGRDAVLAHLAETIDEAEATSHASGSVLGCSIGVLASELAPSNDTARLLAGRAFVRWQHALAVAIRRGIDDGSIARTVDPEATALTLLAAIQGMSTLGRVSNDPERLRLIGETTVKRLLPAPAPARTSRKI